MDKKYAIIT